MPPEARKYLTHSTNNTLESAQNLTAEWLKSVDGTSSLWKLGWRWKAVCGNVIFNLNITTSFNVFEHSEYNVFSIHLVVIREGYKHKINAKRATLFPECSKSKPCQIAVAHCMFQLLKLKFRYASLLP